MADLTTAQRLSAYADELTDAGLDSALVEDIVRDAARAIHENDGEPTVQADLDETNPVVGSVTIELKPQLNEASLERTVAAVHDTITQAQQTAPS